MEYLLSLADRHSYSYPLGQTESDCKKYLQCTVINVFHGCFVLDANMIAVQVYGYTSDHPTFVFVRVAACRIQAAVCPSCLVPA